MSRPKDPLIKPCTDFPDGTQFIYADRRDKYTVSYLPDIVYDSSKGVDLHLQMLYPGMPPMGAMMLKREPARSEGENREAPPVAPTASEPLPLVVFVQGSAWMKQECRLMLPNFTEIVRMGYVVASVEYRPSKTDPWPAFLQDVKAAIRFLRANADRFGIDPDRVAVWGDSSGGHAALLVGATGWTDEFDDDRYSGYSSAVRAAIDFYGLSDIAQINGAPRDPMNTAPGITTPEDILFRTKVSEHPEVCAPANPINYIYADRDYPPFLIMHGDEDGTVPFLQSTLMYEKLRELKKQVSLYAVIGGGHSMRFWTPEVLDVVAKFLRAYL